MYMSKEVILGSILVTVEGNESLSAGRNLHQDQAQDALTR